MGRYDKRFGRHGHPCRYYLVITFCNIFVHRAMDRQI